MAYSELIKTLDNTRKAMLDFYIYGFKNRNASNKTAARTYDNERRRIDSWLSQFMNFRQEPNGRVSFLSIDGRSVLRNPLYNIYKAKSFTDKSVRMHFFLMDVLSDYNWHSLKDIYDETYLNDYMGEDEAFADINTLRKKLKDYTALGILEERRIHKEAEFRLIKNTYDFKEYSDAISFFSEADHLGVIGSLLIDKHDIFQNNIFTFKHHYLLHALDSEVLYVLIKAIENKKAIKAEIRNKGNDPYNISFNPLKIMVSVKTGRQHVVYAGDNGIDICRIDYLFNVKETKGSWLTDNTDNELADFLSGIWGVSGKKGELKSISIDIRIEEDESYVLRRLLSEKRCGDVKKVDDDIYRFTARIRDKEEMLPWIRTFIGRITDIKCDAPEVIKELKRSLYELSDIYK